MAHVFVSYSSKDRPAVRDLIQQLENAGYDVWFDRKLRPGQDWWDEILNQIEGASVFIAALSPDMLESDACIREFQYAEDMGLYIIPIAIVPASDLNFTQMRLEITRRHILNYADDPPTEFDNLREAIDNADPVNTPKTSPDRPDRPISGIPSIRSLIDNNAKLSQDQQETVVNQLRTLRNRNEAKPQELRDVIAHLRKRHGPDLSSSVQRELKQLETNLWPVLVILGGLIILVLVAIVISLLSQNNDPIPLTGTPSQTNVLTETTIPTETATSQPTSTHTSVSTQTALPTVTATTANPTFTPMPTATHTTPPTHTTIPTMTATPEPLPVTPLGEAMLTISYTQQWLAIVIEPTDTIDVNDLQFSYQANANDSEMTAVNLSEYRTFDFVLDNIDESTCIFVIPDGGTTPARPGNCNSAAANFNHTEGTQRALNFFIDPNVRSFIVHSDALGIEEVCTRGTTTIATCEITIGGISGISQDRTEPPTNTPMPTATVSHTPTNLPTATPAAASTPVTRADYGPFLDDVTDEYGSYDSGAYWWPPQLRVSTGLGASRSRMQPDDLMEVQDFEAWGFCNWQSGDLDLNLTLPSLNDLSTVTPPNISPWNEWILDGGMIQVANYDAITREWAVINTQVAYFRCINTP